MMLKKRKMELSKLVGKTNKSNSKQLQRIWIIGIMKKWFCIWYDLANPRIGLNLVPNPI